MCGILQDVNRPGFPWGRSGCHASAAAATPKRWWARMRTGVREDSWDQPCKKCPIFIELQIGKMWHYRGVRQKSIVSKSGFKQIAKTRWILQHFDGISLAKQNADRRTSFLTSMCFQRKNDWIFLRNLSIKPSLWKSSQARSCETQAACFAQWKVANQRTFDAFRFGRGTCPPKQMRLHNGYSSVLLGVLCVG